MESSPGTGGFLHRRGPKCSCCTNAGEVWPGRRMWAPLPSFQAAGISWTLSLRGTGLRRGDYGLGMTTCRWPGGGETRGDRQETEGQKDSSSASAGNAHKALPVHRRPGSHRRPEHSRESALFFWIKSSAAGSCTWILPRTRTPVSPLHDPCNYSARAHGLVETANGRILRENRIEFPGNTPHGVDQLLLRAAAPVLRIMSGYNFSEGEL